MGKCSNKIKLGAIFLWQSALIDRLFVAGALQKKMDQNISTKKNCVWNILLFCFVPYKDKDLASSYCQEIFWGSLGYGIDF